MPKKSFLAFNRVFLRRMATIVVLVEIPILFLVNIFSHGDFRKFLELVLFYGLGAYIGLIVMILICEIILRIMRVNYSSDPDDFGN